MPVMEVPLAITDQGGRRLYLLENDIYRQQQQRGNSSSGLPVMGPSMAEFHVVESLSKSVPKKKNQKRGKNDDWVIVANDVDRT
jgi:hypothetical protein